MNILGLDSAGKTAGVALWQDGVLRYESYLSAGFTHSETLLSLCGDALRALHLSCADVQLFGVCAGPGSFTGLRIGLALVKGLALPNGTPCAGVSTLAALAESCAAEGLIATALDARRGEVYCALFERKGGVLTRLFPDDAMPAPAFALAVARRGAHAPCLGDGAQLVAHAAEELAEGPTSASPLSLWPEAYRFGRAGGVCLAAKAMLDAGKAVDASALTPQYHRLSQAERERNNS